MGRVAIVKTQTQIASASGASELASEMASYGQSLFMEVLGGKRKVCDSSSVLGAIVAVVLAILIIIILVVLAVFTWGSSLIGIPYVILVAGSVLGLAAATAGLIMATIALYEQAFIIQPSITDLWNKSLAAVLSREDMYLEQGISAGWGRIVTDNKQVPDILDFNADGVYGFDGQGKPKDWVSRPAIYYDMRVRGAQNKPVPEIDAFVKALGEFLYKDPDGTGNTWGLIDPLPCCDASNPKCNPNHPCCQSPPPSECNPCCVPEFVNDPTDQGGTGQVRIRPECCDNNTPPNACGVATTSCGTAASCGSLSPYGNAYPYVYNSIFQNQENNNTTDPNFFLSFLEQLGHDDENDKYTIPEPASQANPSLYDPTALQQSIDPEGPLRWRFTDATGFYHDPVWPYPEPRPPGDKQSGIFPFLYKIQDWGMDLNQLNKLQTVSWSGTPLKDGMHCYWYDWAWDQAYDTSGNDCTSLLTGKEMPQELRRQIDWPATNGIFNANPMQALILPQDPNKLIFDKTWWVDGTRDNVCTSGVCNPPLAADKVIVPQGIIAGENECAQNGLEQTDPNTGAKLGFWKRGDVQFCSTQWPYDAHCTQHLWDPVNNTSACVVDQGLPTQQYVDCNCMDPAVDKTLFRDDVLDTMVHGFKDFISLAESVLAMKSMERKNSLSYWGPQMYEWVNPTDGFIAIIRARIQEILVRLKTNWRDLSFQGTTCEEVWCVPPATDLNNGRDCQSALNIPLRERATFDINGNTIRGDMADIIACLEWNSGSVNQNNLNTYADGTTARDNALKFEKCRESCSWDTCRAPRLPRSLVPPADFSRIAFEPADPNPAVATLLETDIKKMLNCYDSIPIGNNTNCTTGPGSQLEKCQAMPMTKFNQSCQKYFTDDPATFNADAIDFDCGHRYFDFVPDSLRRGPPGDPAAVCYGATYFPTYWPADIDFSVPGTWTYADIGNAASAASAAGETNDLNTIQACQLSCNGSPTVCDNTKCQIMPRYQNIFASGTSVDPLAGISYRQEIENAYNWYIDPAHFGPLRAGDPDPTKIKACLTDALDPLRPCLNFPTTCRVMPQYLNQWAAGNQWYDDVQAALTWLQAQTPSRGPGDPDYDAIVACDTACAYTENIPNVPLGNPGNPGGDPAPGATTTCRAMPWFDSQCVADLYFTENPNQDNIPPGAPGDGIGFEVQDCGSVVPWGPGNDWYDRIVGTLPMGASPPGQIDNGALMLANKWCDLRMGDADPTTTQNNGWLLNAEKSWHEAENQVPKFKLRAEFLQQRLDELNNIISVFEKALPEFDALLNAAKDLIDCYQNSSTCLNEESGLPYTLIYGWQSDPPQTTRKSAPGEGYWHIVKVEARSPKRCDGACGVPGTCSSGGATCPDPAFPTVKTSVSGFMDTTRCYELENTDGLVKFRVTRWDEDRDSNLITFPGGIPIWQFHLPEHPARGKGTIGNTTAAGLYTACKDQFYQPPSAISIPAQYKDVFGRAFLLSERIDGSDGVDPSIGRTVNIPCWQKAVDLVSQGVMTEVCAQYYYHENGLAKGMSFKFVPCPDKF